jgi:anti-anti-sigma factor
VPIIKHTANGEVRVIAIDEVRLVEGPAIEECYREIVAALEKCGESCAVLHFGRVSFMSSSALGMLVRVMKKCKEYKIAMKLSNIAPEIRQVFKITGLDKLFDIQNDVPAAMAAFKKSGQLLFRTNKPTTYNVREES